MPTTTRSATARAWSISRSCWLRTFELLARNLDLLTHYQERFRNILWTSSRTRTSCIQWIRMLAGSNGCVFAVGDDDQSIYRFRGADVGNINEFLPTSGCGKW